MQKITLNLWFDTQAVDAAKYYTSIFKNSILGKTACYGKEGHDIHKMPAGTVMTIEFELDGQKFVALNGGPVFKFNESISMIVNCKDQEEVDYYWEKLKEGGDEKAQQCGWLKDKFGVSWQIVPTILNEMMTDPHLGNTEALMREMLKMKKLDVAKLKAAYEEK